MAYLLADAKTSKLCARYRTREEAYRAAVAWSRDGERRVFALGLEWVADPVKAAEASKADPDEIFETHDGRLLRHIPTGEYGTNRITPCLPDGTPTL